MSSASGTTVEEAPRGQEPGAQRLLVAAALVGHDHGPDPVRDELEDRVVPRLAHRERRARQMRAEIRRGTPRRRRRAGRPGPGSRPRRGRAPRAPRPGSTGPVTRRQGRARAAVVSGHAASAARKRGPPTCPPPPEITTSPCGAPPGAGASGREVARVDEAVAEPVGEGEGAVERDRHPGSRGRARDRSTGARPRRPRARTTPGSACSRGRPGGSPRRAGPRRRAARGRRPPRGAAAPART